MPRYYRICKACREKFPSRQTFREHWSKKHGASKSVWELEGMEEPESLDDDRPVVVSAELVMEATELRRVRDGK